MFDSPYEYCAACKEYVALDQTQNECAREHGCDDLSKCPLRKLFVGMQPEGPSAIAEAPRTALAR